MQEEHTQLWNVVLNDIELAVSKANFNTWFKDTSILKEEEGVIFVNVPNAFVKEWLRNKYHSTILKSLRDNNERVRSLEYIITKTTKRGTGTTTTHTTPQQNEVELPLSEYYVNKESNLNPRYTFETFVVGPFNELAYAASQAVIAKPGLAYNPLFIYGNTGLGKTHLMQAVGNYYQETFEGKKVFYVTSERFALDYINSVQKNSTNQFKEKYRKYDLLLMDDIQFLSNKEKTQEELFHLFNTLYDNNKQIVFSSDKHPNYIPNLEDRLKSRFAAGMIVDIPTPDHESRAAIIKEKAKIINCPLKTEMVDFLASHLSGSIRELEGALNAIGCQARLKGRELSLNEVKLLLKNTEKPRKSISPEEVVKIVADFYNVEERNIYEKTRRKEIIKPRQLTMYILREDLHISYPSIGQKLGGRDHTTVIHSCEKIKEHLEVDTGLAQEIEQIRSMIL